MTREQQYWEDTQEALSRILYRCEETDPQSGYEMLEDIQFIRGFINKCKPRAEKQEPILDKIRKQIKDYLRGVEITLEVLVENDPLRPKMEGAKDTLEECLELIDKAETEVENGNDD